MSSQIKLGYVDTTIRTTDETFLSCLRAGRVPWDLLRPFPEPSERELRAGDAVIEEISAVFRSHISPDELDATGKFPAQLVKEMRERGYSKLQQPAEVGGLGLDAYTTFRVLERIGTWSMAAANTLGITNTVGPGAILRALEPGPLRDYVSARIGEGCICAFGDTGPDGQNNRFSGLTATLTEDGSAYLLNGRKLFTGNAPIADLIAVSATVQTNDGPAVVFPFLDTSSPGFRLVSDIEFLGYKGFPDAEIRFDDVRVPAEHVLTGVEEPERLRTLTPVAVEGRILNVVSLALAVGRQCAGWSRDFIDRRRIDGKGLREYDQIQRIVSSTLADVFAIETIAQWTLLSAPADKLFEQIVAKTLAARTGWRIVDRTMTLFGGEGLETAPSKERRGAVPVPLERYFRDARILRTIVNVDFQIDNQAGQILLARFYGDAPDVPRPGWRFGRRSRLPAGAPLDGTGLSAANQRHLTNAAGRFTDLWRICADLTKAYPDPKELFARERLVILISRIASELFAVTAVLARASQRSETQILAEVYATEAGHRLADLTLRLSAELGDEQPDYAGLTDSWITGQDLDFLLFT